MIQTNGILLDCLDPQIVNRFTTILVSIDGNETLTDGQRGSGLYRKVMPMSNFIPAIVAFPLFFFAVFVAVFKKYVIVKKEMLLV